jgi:hypothetical protein
MASYRRLWMSAQAFEGTIDAFERAGAAHARAQASLARADQLHGLAQDEDDVYRRDELLAAARVYRELAEIHEAAAEAQRRFARNGAE